MDTALPLKPACTPYTSKRQDVVRSLLADALTPTGAWFALLVQLLRLVAAAAVYMQPSGSHLASDRRGRKPGLPPAVVDEKTEGCRVSGEVLHALLGRLGYRSLLLLLFTCAAAPNGPQRIRLGPTAAYAPFTAVYRQPRARPLAVELVLVKGFEALASRWTSGRSSSACRHGARGEEAAR